VFYSYLLGAIFFGDRMTLLGLFGVALILVGVLMVTMRSPKGVTSQRAMQHSSAAALDKQPVAAAAQPAASSAVLGASRAASLAAAAGVEDAGKQRQTASLTPTLSRRASAKAAAKGREGLGGAMEQPLLQHIKELSALQQGAASGAADAAVIITATGALVTMAENQTAAAAAPMDGGSNCKDAAGGTAEPGVLSAFVQAALQSAVRESDPGSAVDGACLTLLKILCCACIVVLLYLWGAGYATLAVGLN
jgi:hypothetical protein